MTQTVRVISGTGSAGIPQVNIVTATGTYPGNIPTWTQLTAAQAQVGPTGSYRVVQKVNPGTTGGQEVKTALIIGYSAPA